jgi:hypothetical protein
VTILLGTVSVIRSQRYGCKMLSDGVQLMYRVLPHMCDFFFFKDSGGGVLFTSMLCSPIDEPATG